MTRTARVVNRLINERIAIAKIMATAKSTKIRLTKKTRRIK